MAKLTKEQKELLTQYIEKNRADVALKYPRSRLVDDWFIKQEHGHLEALQNVFYQLLGVRPEKDDLKSANNFAIWLSENRGVGNIWGQLSSGAGNVDKVTGRNLAQRLLDLFR